MQFVLTGFRHDAALRVFEFEGIAADHTRTNYFVSADLMLIQRYGIRVQELPLLCRRLLEQHEFGENEHTLTYAEENMRTYMNYCTAEREAAQRKKPPRRPPSNTAQNRIVAVAATASAE